MNFVESMVSASIGSGFQTWSYDLGRCALCSAAAFGSAEARSDRPSSGHLGCVVSRHGLPSEDGVETSFWNPSAWRLEGGRRLPGRLSPLRTLTVTCSRSGFGALLGGAGYGESIRVPTCVRRTFPEPAPTHPDWQGVAEIRPALHRPTHAGSRRWAFLGMR